MMNFEMGGGEFHFYSKKENLYDGLMIELVKLFQNNILLPNKQQINVWLLINYPNSFQNHLDSFQNYLDSFQNYLVFPILVYSQIL